MAQVQCPNCGGYKTDMKIEPIYGETLPLTHSERKSRWIAWLLFGGFTIPLIPVYFIALGVLRIVDAMRWTDLSGLIRLLVFVPMSPFLIGSPPFFLNIIWGAILWFALFKIIKGKQPIKRTIHHYTCWLCGYKWDWEPGTPLPSVTVRPDLIAKGEQRLEEEQRLAEEQARGNAVAQDILRRQGVIK
ncbi:MAG: hypothetical protein KGJ80_18035 [Chloroflexota bacterium]|nr:hypothetical protein [Chloroflexota bacterium]